MKYRIVQVNTRLFIVERGGPWGWAVVKSRGIDKLFFSQEEAEKFIEELKAPKFTHVVINYK